MQMAPEVTGLECVGRSMHSGRVMILPPLEVRNGSKTDIRLAERFIVHLPHPSANLRHVRAQLCPSPAFEGIKARPVLALLSFRPASAFPRRPLPDRERLLRSSFRRPAVGHLVAPIVRLAKSLNMPREAAGHCSLAEARSRYWLVEQ